MTDKQIRDKIVGVLSASMIPMKTELECIQFLDRCLAAMSWIPVAERLPLCGERVLITEGTTVFEAYLSISHKWVRAGIGWVENVTHWQPLPQAPGKEGA